jgi:hypothetical protein
LADEVLVTKSVGPCDEFFDVCEKYEDVVFMRGDDNLDFPGKHIIDSFGIPIEYVKYTEGVSSTEIRLERSVGEG